MENRFFAYCPHCGESLEVREISIRRGGMVDYKKAYVCPHCDYTCELEDICDVCKRPQDKGRLVTTAYHFPHFGRYEIRHCPTCSPPSKLQVEWELAPWWVLCRYGCISSVILFFLIIFIIIASQR